MNKKTGFLISLSGFDGAGKSTQVALLSKYLRSKGKSVRVTEAMFGYFLLRPLIKVLRGATGSLQGGPVKRNQSLLPKFWFVLAFIDVWVGFIFKIRPMRNKYDFLIADRFYTDIWANLLYYGYLPDWAFSFFVKLLPKPDVAFMLKAKPKIVLTREKEFHPSYYREQEKIYDNLSVEVNFNIVDANQLPKIIFGEMKEGIKDLV